MDDVGDTDSDSQKRPEREWGAFKVAQKVMLKRGYGKPEDALREREYDEGTLLPALSDKDWSLDVNRQSVLCTLYTETCAAWRCLTDVRFKLLGFLPAASFAGLVAIFENGERGPKLRPAEQTLVSIFGAIVVSGLWLYEQRNTALYDDLVARGRRIEAELGIHTGCFRGRPKSVFPVQHDVAIHLVYATSILAWLVSAVWRWL